MLVEQVLEPDWASLTPGPEVDVLLEGVDLAAVDGEQLVGVLQASWRQLSHGHALYLAAMVEVGRRERAEALREKERTSASTGLGASAGAAAMSAAAETDRGSPAWLERDFGAGARRRSVLR